MYPRTSRRSRKLYHAESTTVWLWRGTYIVHKKRRIAGAASSYDSQDLGPNSYNIHIRR
jgi:hypothetical protein